MPKRYVSGGETARFALRNGRSLNPAMAEAVFSSIFASMAGGPCLLGKVCRDAWLYCCGAIARVGIGRMTGMGESPE